MADQKPYGRYRIEVKLYDERMNAVDAFDLRQDLLADESVFAVRLTRETLFGKKAQYEDRGSVNETKAVTGTSGFGGQLSGQLLPNGSLFLRGDGGDASFVLVATKTADDHYRCFRRIEVRKATTFGTELTPGLYFMTTEDFLEESADKPPPEMKAPLKS